MESLLSSLVYKYATYFTELFFTYTCKNVGFFMLITCLGYAFNFGNVFICAGNLKQKMCFGIILNVKNKHISYENAFIQNTNV